jgi:hypothetical protein
LNGISPAQQTHHCHESSHQQWGRRQQQQQQQGFHLALHQASTQEEFRADKRMARETHRETETEMHIMSCGFLLSKKQTLAKTTYLLLCYAYTQFLNPGRRDLQEPLPANSKLSETI